MKKANDFVLVIFGASGDLAWRKLIPALCDLFNQNLLPEKFKIVGVGRTKMSDEDFRAKMAVGIEKFVAKEFAHPEKLASFVPQLHYHSMETADGTHYAALRDKLEALSGACSCNSNFLYYFAMPPAMYAVVAKNLHDVGLSCQDNGWKRLIVEKPFGHDLASAKILNRDLQSYFHESQIYRIDHYLGKETVQNILVTRFSNSIFEPLWNRNYIERVEITSSESLGVGSRAGYYEGAGALRDMLQNHLLQLLGIVAMEPPVSADPNAIRNEIVKVFQSLREVREEDVAKEVVRGQYTSSVVRGESLKGYREEVGVAADSRTDTFVAMRCFIDNWRWNGVPFYIRTGKCLPTRVTEIVIHFKPNPHVIFASKNMGNNQLIIRIQPDEGLLLKFGMKIPGSGFVVDQVNMDFHYSSLSDVRIPEAYERLLYDCMLGDATLYQRSDAVEATWKFVQPIITAWENNHDIPIFGYPAGSWGPEQSDELLARDGYQWRYPCKNLASDGQHCEL